jgi:hypothetical protein
MGAMLATVLTALVGLVIWVAYAIGWKWLFVKIVREGIWHGLKVAWRSRDQRKGRH